VEKILGSSQQSLERNVFSEWQEKCFAPEAACLVKEIAILALYNWRKYDANQQKFPLNLQRFFKSVAVAYRISTWLGVVKGMIINHQFSGPSAYNLFYS